MLLLIIHFSLVTWHLYISGSVRSNLALSHSRFSATITSIIGVSDYPVSVKDGIYIQIRLQIIIWTCEQVLVYNLSSEISQFLIFEKTTKWTHQNFSDAKRLAQKRIKSTYHILDNLKDSVITYYQAAEPVSRELFANRWMKLTSDQQFFPIPPICS